MIAIGTFGIDISDRPSVVTNFRGAYGAWLFWLFNLRRYSTFIFWEGLGQLR